MQALKIRVVQFATDYNARGIYFSSLANAEVQRMIIMKFLMCHRHSYTDLLLREPVPAASATVRQVEEYIEANWHKPLDIQALTRVAGVSARSFFRQFKKERGQTPWEFVKSVRIRKALIMLENPGPSTSVTQIALKCGFQNTGHFAQAYRTAFGELPSETLRRALRLRIGNCGSTM
jgi:transcriptional regulator GlxA family with amidase domain